MTELCVDGVSVEIGGSSVVDGASFAARPGEIVAIVGPNGAGKTTLLEAIVGLQRLARGSISFAGAPIRSFRERAAVFAYMPDEAALPEEAAVNTILNASGAEVRRIDAEIARFRLEHLR